MKRWLRRSSFLVESLAIAVERDHSGGEEKQRHRADIHQNVGRCVPFQQYAANDPQEMRERQDFADPLCPDRHAAKGKHEA